MAIVGTASVRISAITTGFEAQIYRALKRVEAMADRGPISDLFTFDTKSSKQLSREADGTYESINQLIRVAYRMQGAIAAAVPIVAQLVAGLFALGAQAAAAAPALIVLPAAMTAIMQAAITAKLALGGVFKAVGELGKQKTGGVDRMPAKLAAIANAQTRLKAAQDALNRSYREAAERLQQLGFDSEDAAISQERSAMALESARETLARVQDLPPNSRARKEAELAFKEADLNYRRAIDRSNDLAEEQDRVTKNGTLNAEEQIEQSDEVVRAKREVEEATRELAKAQKDLNSSTASGLTEFNKLSKAAQEFAKYLVSLKPEIQKLKDAAGAELFGPLQDAIQNLVDNFFPRLIPLLRRTGKALGETAKDFSEIVTEAVNLRNFETVGNTNIYIIERLGKVVGNLYSAFISLLAAAGPLVRRFADWVVELTEGWRRSKDSADEMSRLTDMFNKAGDVAAQLGDIFGNLAGGIMNMGRAASGPGSGGQMIFDALERSTERFKDWSKAVLEDGSLAEYFRHASTGFMKIAEIVGKVFKIIMKSATADENFVVLDSISRAVDNLGKAFNEIVGSGPAFGRFIESFSRIMLVTSESGSIEVFFNILTKAMNAFSSLMENEVVRQIFKFLAAWHAARLAFGVIMKVFTTVAMYMLGAFRAMYSSVSTLVNIFSKIGIPAGATAAIFAIVAILILAYKYSEKFRKSIADLVKVVIGELKAAWKEVSDAFKAAFGGMGKEGINFGNIFRNIGDFLSKTLVPVLRVILVGAIRALANSFVFIIKVVANVIKIFNGLVKIFGGIIKLFKGDFKGALGSFKDGISSILGAIGGIVKAAFSAIIDGIKDAPLMRPIISMFSKAFGAVGKIIGPIIDGISKVISPVANALKPVIKVIVFIAKLIRNIFYIAFLIVFTTIGIIIAEMWRKLKSLAEIIAKKLGGAVKKFKDIAVIAFAAIGGVVMIMYALISGGAKAAFAFLKKTFNNILPIAKRVFSAMSEAFSKAWDVISEAVPWAWNNVIKPTFEKIKEVWEKVLSGVRWAFENIWPKIWGGIQWAWENVIKKAFSLILSYWKFVIKAIRWAFENVWPKIWGGIQWAWENVIKPAFTKIFEAFKFYWGLIKQAFDLVWPYIWTGIQWAWNNVIKPVFGMLGSVFSAVWSKIKAAFDLVWPYIWTGIQWAWNNVIKPTFEMLGTVFSTVWNGIKTAFDFVWPYISGAISFAWENVIKPVFDLLGSVFSAAWDKIKAAFDVVWPAIWGGIQWAWNNVIQPVFGKISSVFKAVWDGVKEAFSDVWGGIKKAFTDFPGFIKEIFNKVIGFFNGLFDGIVEGFKQIPTLIGKIWDGVIDLFRKGINLIIDGFNNTLGGKKFTLPGILGGGTFGFDKINPIGSGKKNDPEQIITGGYRDIPGLALGGTVLPRAGGTLVRVAEAGRPERVEPLDPDGLSKRDKAMIAALTGGLSGASINVYPSARMDEVELASLVSRQIAFQLRKGAA